MVWELLELGHLQLGTDAVGGERRSGQGQNDDQGEGDAHPLLRRLKSVALNVRAAGAVAGDAVFDLVAEVAE